MSTTHDATSAPGPCRLLYLVGQLSRGGLERQLVSLLEAMDRERYQPAVVVWSAQEDAYYAPRIKELGVEVHSIGHAPTLTAKLAALRHLVRELQPEVVHSYSFYTNFAAWWSTRSTQAIPIGSIRSNFTAELQRVKGIRGKLCARWPKTQICNSANAQRTVQRFSGRFKPLHLHTVRNGLDISRFPVAPLPQNGASIVAMGRFCPEKRWDILLSALAQVSHQGLDFTARLAGDGPLLPEMQALCAQIGLQDKVEFLGFRADVPELLQDSTLLALTSDIEGCPNVVMEAMAGGRAVVATAAGDVPDLVEEGKTGFVVPCGDAAALAGRIATLINDRDLCRAMGLAGRAKAEHAFGLDRLVEETLTVYQSAGWQRG